MEKDYRDEFLKNITGSFDFEEPDNGHEQRFLAKLNKAQGTASISQKKTFWWKPLSIAASIVLAFGIFYGINNTEPSVDERVAKISPEVSNAQFHFASLIQEQVKALEAESSPETQKIVADTMDQLKSLEMDYNKLEGELLKGGNSKLILSAMITNFQTRIDLLNDVLNQIETIKNLKNYNDENFTI
ncbi:hypothetical protein EJ994_02240 [Maribacter sp. MJ134]|uniref:hypothetical protein n=1 Tax=Maribacter sp. MJ134 TaxID=2496865 RepID=UPI000F83CEC5|nr:hypothetical protein [Maribacter sp. MJ134]AZQ57682.1 hypothetical protein EJ994_02240 [Maribacter sp. MJ134]